MPQTNGWPQPTLPVPWRSSPGPSPRFPPQPMLPVPQCKSPWQRGELKLFAGIAQGVSSIAGNPTLGLSQGVSGAAGNPTAGLVQGVADHPTLLKSQGVSAKSMVVKSKAVSGQASVVEANCTNIDVCPELFLPPRDQKRKSVLKDLRLTHLFTMIGKYIKLVLKEGLLTPLFLIRRAWNLKIFLQNMYNMLWGDCRNF